MTSDRARPQAPSPGAAPGAAGESGASPCDLPGQVLRRGTWKKAEVRLAQFEGVAIVIKDCRRSPRAARWLARFICRREARFYRKLSGLPGVASLVAEGDRVLALEHVPGRFIGDLGGVPGFEEVPARLERLVRELHRQGVYHVDLRRRDNILVEDDGRPTLIDFAASVMLRPAGWAPRFLRPLLEIVDRYGVLKWKKEINPESMSPRERRLVRTLDRIRFWRPA